MASLKGNSSTAQSGVIGVNDWAPAAPPGAGGNGGWFESSQGEGVRGWAKTPYHGGVVGVNTAGGIAVYGQSDDGVGVLGESKNNEGVHGVSHNPNHGGVVGANTAGGIAVYGQSDDGVGVFGESKNNEGVHGVSHNARAGVFGVNDWAPADSPGAGGNGAWFESSQGEGVRGWAKTPYHGGVVGVNTAGGIGVYGESDQQGGIGVSGKGGRLAGFFEGNVEVTGDITLTNSDCAEDFDIADADSTEPGTVMVLGEEEVLLPSYQPYDKRVAGVISGAGNYKPGIVLDKKESQQRRLPVALLGKVFCKVDAQFGPIAVGDLLTTSSTPGHAMRSDDPMKAFGAVIGKALRALKEGQGLIPILIALQ